MHSENESSADTDEYEKILALSYFMQMMHYLN